MQTSAGTDTSRSDCKRRRRHRYRLTQLPGCHPVTDDALAGPIRWQHEEHVTGQGTGPPYGSYLSCGMPGSTPSGSNDADPGKDNLRPKGTLLATCGPPQNVHATEVSAGLVPAGPQLGATRSMQIRQRAGFRRARPGGTTTWRYRGTQIWQGVGFRRARPGGTTTWQLPRRTQIRQGAGFRRARPGGTTTCSYRGATQMQGRLSAGLVPAEPQFAATAEQAEQASSPPGSSRRKQRLSSCTTMKTIHTLENTNPAFQLSWSAENETGVSVWQVRRDVWASRPKHGVASVGGIRLVVATAGTSPTESHEDSSPVGSQSVVRSVGASPTETQGVSELQQQGVYL